MKFSLVIPVCFAAIAFQSCTKNDITAAVKIICPAETSVIY